MLHPLRMLRWIYLGRLSVALAIFIAAVINWGDADATDTLVAALALFCTIAFTAGSFARTWQARRPPSRVFFLAQSTFDVLLVTAILHLTGGGTSQLAALYIIVIASAAVLLPVSWGLAVAGLASAAYLALLVFGHPATLAWGIALQLIVFAAVALGIAFLSTRLREASAGKEQLAAQLALAKLQADDILRNIGSGILTVDDAGRLLYVNPTAGRLLGLDPDVAVGRPIHEMLETLAPGLLRAMERTMRDRVRINRGEAAILRDGRTISIGMTTMTIDSGREPSGVSATAIFQDITDNKRMEALRLRAERLEAVTELSASLAHEIKNPLASIRSAVEQLAGAPRATEDERVLCNLIVRESDRLSRLLSEFLDFARVRVTRLGPVDLGAVARSAATLAAAHPDCRADVEVQCVVPQGPVIVEGDEDLLHRVAFNIALNAVQASPTRGTVRIEVARVAADQVPPGAPFDRDAVSLRIVDGGAGIREDIRDRIFDPFFTTKSGGTGLGLPIVHRAIDALRGVVLVESAATGTTFTVLLPHADPLNGDPS
jgi:two-component system sensor histidine kinase PilS (NtrC family)